MVKFIGYMVFPPGNMKKKTRITEHYEQVNNV